MSTLKYKSGAISRLASPYTAGDGSLTVLTGEGARFSAGGDSWIKIGLGDFVPIRKATSRSGDVISFTGGAQSNTSDADAPTGTTVSEVMTEESMDQFRSDVTRVMTYSTFTGLASTEYKDGDYIILSDSQYHVVRSGGAWVYLYQGIVVTPPPAIASWTQVNMGTSILTETTGGIYIETQLSGGAGASNLRILARSIPSTPYSIEAVVLWATSKTNGGGIGIGWRESSTGKLVLLKAGADGTAPFGAFTKYTNPTTFSANYTSTYSYGPGHRVQFLKITDNGTNLSVFGSVDGFNWGAFGSGQARTNFMAGGPNQVVYFAETTDTTFTTQATLLSWKVY